MEKWDIGNGLHLSVQPYISNNLSKAELQK